MNDNLRCADCNHYEADHNTDETCALCGCDWFVRVDDVVVIVGGIPGGHVRPADNEDGFERCPGSGSSREDRTLVSPEAIEAALEHTRQLNFWEGINDPVWDESEIRKITEAAIRAFIKAQYILPEAIEAAVDQLGRPYAHCTYHGDSSVGASPCCTAFMPGPYYKHIEREDIEAAIAAFMRVQYGIEEE